MIIQTVTQSVFVEAFDEMNRSDNFSGMAQRALFSYYDELSEELDECFELDVIAICGDWDEMTAEEVMSHYGHLLGDIDTTEEGIQELAEELTVIKVDQPYRSEETYLILLS